jgi:hypothetical protein
MFNKFLMSAIIPANVGNLDARGWNITRNYMQNNLDSRCALPFRSLLCRALSLVHDRFCAFEALTKQLHRFVEVGREV